MMKSILVLAVIVSTTIGGFIPHKDSEPIGPDNPIFLDRQKILELFYNVTYVDPTAEYYKVGKDYDIKTNAEHYYDKEAVNSLVKMYTEGTLPKSSGTIKDYFKYREQSIVLLNLFTFAVDFDTFYKTAAWARIHLNEGMFLHTFYLAVMIREETRNIGLPYINKTYPELFDSKPTSSTPPPTQLMSQTLI